MKRLLTVLSVLILLAACTGKHQETDAQRFAREFGVTEDNHVSYLEKDDVIYQLTHGTHVVLFTTAGSVDSRNQLEPLIKAVDSHSGIVLYYYDIEKADDDLTAQVNKLLEPFDEQLRDMTAVFIKQGEITETVIWKAIYSSVVDYQKLVDDIVSEIDPGCHDC